MLGLFKSGTAAQAASLWSRKGVIAALKKRYGAIEDLGEENGFAVYGVNEGEIRFAVVLALVEGASDKVAEVGFLARFSGFNLTAAQLDSVNRNLHISIATFHTDGDLYLIGGIAAAGAFSESTFLLVLEAWKRDLLVIIQSMSLSHSLAATHAVARLETAARFATNRLPEGEISQGDLFADFAGGALRRLSTCGGCAGRGKTGFIAKPCEECEGSGFVAARRR